MLGEARRLAQQHARQALATIEEIELTLRGTNAPPLDGPTARSRSRRRSGR
jgi:hypothetical protein